MEIISIFSFCTLSTERGNSENVGNLPQYQRVIVRGKLAPTCQMVIRDQEEQRDPNVSGGWTNQFHCIQRHFWLTNNLYVRACACVCVCVTHSQINGESGGKEMHDMVTLYTKWASLVAQMLKNLLQCRRPRFDP